MSARAVRRARVVLTIGRASWRVCESCADLLERESRNWGRKAEKVRRVRIAAPTLKPSKGTGDEERKMASTQEKEPRPKGGRRTPATLVRTTGSLAREERTEAKRSRARARKLKRTAKKATRSFGAAVKGGKEAEKKRRRAEWLANHPSEDSE